MTHVKALRGRRMRLTVNSDGRVVRTHTRRYRVLSDILIDPFEALAELGLEAYEPHEADSAASVRSIDIEEELTRSSSDSTHYTYLATIEWSTEMPEPRGEDPLSEPPRSRWSGIDVSKAVYKDREGRAILNTAGDYFFDPSLEATIVHPVLTISRNEPTFVPAFVFAYAGTINSAEFYGAPPRTLKMKSPAAESDYYNGQVYWKVTYEFELNLNEWQPEVLNQGLREKAIGPTTYRRPILDKESRRPITDPVPLNQGGQPVPLEDLPDNAVFLRPEILLERDFNELGL